MNQAAVGFQCPECVREGRKTVRTARTAFGGRLDGEQGQVTRVLVAINVAMFVATVGFGLLEGGAKNAGLIMSSAFGMGGSENSVLYRLFVLIPTTLVYDRQGHIVDGVAQGEYWRLFTADYMHYGILHLLLNMWALLILGREVERMLGRWRYLALYLLAGFGSSVAVYWLSEPNSATAGASGSIFGLFGALLIFVRKLRLDPRQLFVLVAINFGFGFFVGASWQGHLGGFVVGALVAGVLAYAPRGPNRTPVQIGGLVVVTVALLGLVVLRTAALTAGV
jgi:membrane associated rhomboid family serine protease